MPDSAKNWFWGRPFSFKHIKLHLRLKHNGLIKDKSHGLVQKASAKPTVVFGQRKFQGRRVTVVKGGRLFNHY